MKVINGKSSSTKQQLRVHKLGEEELKKFMALHQMLNGIFKYELKSKQEFTTIIKSEDFKIYEEAFVEDEIDLQKFFAIAYTEVLCNLWLMNLGYATLTNALCDPNLSYIDYKPWIKNAGDTLKKVEIFLEGNRNVRRQQSDQMLAELKATINRINNGQG